LDTVKSASFINYSSISSTETFSTANGGAFSSKFNSLASLTSFFAYVPSTANFDQTKMMYFNNDNCAITVPNVTPVSPSTPPTPTPTPPPTPPPVCASLPYIYESTNTTLPNAYVSPSLTSPNSITIQISNISADYASIVPTCNDGSLAPTYNPTTEIVTYYFDQSLATTTPLISVSCLLEITDKCA
jgi:hypothetical protein